MVAFGAFLTKTFLNSFAYHCLLFRPARARQAYPLDSLLSGRILSTQCPNNEELMNECGICKRCTDQHLLAKCDTCHLYYHLGCLSPPLMRHPKKSKQYGWQCSECDKSDDSGPECKIIPKAPRRSRIR